MPSLLTSTSICRAMFYGMIFIGSQINQTRTDRPVTTIIFIVSCIVSLYIMRMHTCDSFCIKFKKNELHWLFTSHGIKCIFQLGKSNVYSRKKKLSIFFNFWYVDSSAFYIYVYMFYLLDLSYFVVVGRKHYPIL